jgi:ankyrin repeat protein
MANEPQTFGLNREALTKISQVFIRGPIDSIAEKLASACSALRCVHEPNAGVEVGDGVPIILVQQKNCEWTGLLELGFRNRKMFEFFGEPKVKELSERFKSQLIAVFHEGVSETIGYCMYEHGKLMESLSKGETISFKSELRKISPDALDNSDARAMMHDFLKIQNVFAPLVPSFSIEKSTLLVKAESSMERLSVLVLKESLVGRSEWQKNLSERLQQLLHSGEPPGKSQKSVADKLKWEPASPEQELLCAARDGNLEEIKWLLSSGVSVNTLEAILMPAPSSTFIINYHKKTPLIWAAEQGHIAVVQHLLSVGAEVNASDFNPDSNQSQKTTALLYAVINRHSEVVTELLKAKADVNIHNNHGSSPLIQACRKGEIEIVKELIRAGAKVSPKQKRPRSTPLQAAIGAGQLEIAILLLDEGANIDQEDALCRTALMFAVRETSLTSIRLLLKRGAQINFQTKDGTSALMSACMGDKHDIEVVKELVQAGADVNLKDENGRTALDRASKYKNTRKATIAFLESVGAKLGEDV